ncbi:MAG: hypothetical protein HY053_02425, partial [Proteobacteria bacterium]|nr:hypothetical protein [Pseudomonadota bacterium]
MATQSLKQLVAGTEVCVRWNCPTAPTARHGFALGTIGGEVQILLTDPAQVEGFNINLPGAKFKSQGIPSNIAEIMAGFRHDLNAAGT